MKVLLKGLASLGYLGQIISRRGYCGVGSVPQVHQKMDFLQSVALAGAREDSLSELAVFLLSSFGLVRPPDHAPSRNYKSTSLKYSPELLRPRGRRAIPACAESLSLEPGVQNNLYYQQLKDDGARTKPYEKAIEARAKNKVCVDIGTGGLALLAILAAKAGAKHVYAIEADRRAYENAVLEVASQGLADRITLFHGFSADVEIPQSADLLIHEIIGEVAGGEGVVAAVLDAKRFLSKPTKSTKGFGKSSFRDVSIPARACTLLAPAEWPSQEMFTSLNTTAVQVENVSEVVRKFSTQFPRSALLARPQVFEDLRLDAASPAGFHNVTLDFVVKRSGQLNGLALHIELFMTDATKKKPDISSADVPDRSTSWQSVFLMLPKPQLVEMGEKISVQAVLQLEKPTPYYSFDVVIDGKHIGTMQYPDEEIVPMWLQNKQSLTFEDWKLANKFVIEDFYSTARDQGLQKRLGCSEAERKADLKYLETEQRRLAALFCETQTPELWLQMSGVTGLKAALQESLR